MAAILFALFIQAVFSPYVSATECSSVDLRPKLGAVRNQDGIGWCYAFAAADLLNVNLGRTPFKINRGVASGNSLSAADIALTYNRIQGDTEVETGGYMDRALKSALDHGVCQESAFRSQRVYNFASKDSRPETFQFDLNQIRARFQTARTHQNCSDCVSRVMQEVDDLFPGVERAVLTRLLEDRSLNMNSFLTQLRNASCGGRTFKSARKPAIWIKREGWDFVGDRVKQYLDRQLNRGIPLGISYNVNRILKVGLDGASIHASSIVGRRKQGSQCEYLLRNSWGPGCGGYKYPCEAGNVWVPESELDMVKYTVWLEG